MDTDCARPRSQHILPVYRFWRAIYVLGVVRLGDDTPCIAAGTRSMLDRACIHYDICSSR